MTKRFIKVFGAILVYMVVASGFLWLVIQLAERQSSFGLIIGGAISLVLVAFIPYLAWCTSRFFYFPGEGTPVSPGELKAELLATNDFDVPIMVVQEEDRLIFTWRYVDARWWELLARAGLTQVYELHVKLDAQRYQARLIDVTKRVSWQTGPADMQLRANLFRGVLMAVEIGEQWGIQENFGLGNIYDFRFTPGEIKIPVLNTLLQHGWSVRFAFW